MFESRRVLLTDKLVPFPVQPRTFQAKGTGLQAEGATLTGPQLFKYRVKDGRNGSLSSPRGTLAVQPW